MKLRKNLLVIFAIHISLVLFAGNPDRTGQAGASELLLNPWGRSAGLHSISTAFATGVEALRINIAGLSRIKNMEIAVSNNRLYEGSGLQFNGLGMAFKKGKNSAFGIEFAMMDFGEIPVTTVNQPAGTGGFFNPAFFQLGLGYSYTYANKISVGMAVRLVSESILDVNATGLAVDAGVQYVSGPQDNFKLGISLRNVGTPMSFSGEGLSVKGLSLDPTSNLPHELTFEYRAASFELPSMLNMGVSYDYYVGDKTYIRGLFNFTSNAFSRDQIGAGAEFSFLNQFTLRAAYKYDIGKVDAENANIYTGFSGGGSIEVPFSKGKGNNLGIDYAYRATNPFRGSHNLTIRFSL